MSTCVSYNCSPPPLRCLALTHHLFCFFLAHCQLTQNDHCKSTLHNLPMHMDNSPSTNIAHLSRPWFIGRVALSFLVRPSVRPAMVTSNQISTFFNIYRHTSLVLIQFHLKPSSTKLYWPSTTKYQLVPPQTDPAPLNTKQYQVKLTKYQPVPPYTDPVPPSTNQHLPSAIVYESPCN